MPEHASASTMPEHAAASTMPEHAAVSTMLRACYRVRHVLRATTKALMAEVSKDFSEGSEVAFRTFCEGKSGI